MRFQKYVAGCLLMVLCGSPAFPADALTEATIATLPSFSTGEETRICPPEHDECYLYFFSIYCTPSMDDLKGRLGDLILTPESAPVFVVVVDGEPFRRTLLPIVNDFDAMQLASTQNRLFMDRNNEVADLFGIEKVPAVVEYRHGEAVETILGMDAVDHIGVK